MSKEPQRGEKGFIDTKDVRAALDPEAITALEKISAKQWQGAADFMGEMNDFSKGGGIQALLGGTTEFILQTLTTKVEALFAPITNELTQFVADIGSDEGVKGAIQSLTDTVSDLFDTLGEMGTIDSISDIIETFANTITKILTVINDLITEHESVQKLLTFLTDQLVLLAKSTEFIVDLITNLLELLGLLPTDLEIPRATIVDQTGDYVFHY